MTASLMELGLRAAKAGDSRAAAQHFGRALELNPDDAGARAWLGQTLCHLGEPRQGRAHLARSAEQLLDAPSPRPDLALEIVGQLQQWGDVPEALRLCRRIAERESGNREALYGVAALSGQMNLTAEALAAGLRAEALDPGDVKLQVLLASLEADEGRYGNARARLERVLNGAPAAAEAFRAHKELARVLDALGEYGAVPAHLDAAASSAAQLREFRVHDPRVVPRRIEANFDAFAGDELLGRWSAADFAGERKAPVFILGFYRSGTTLTQQVLATHPEVFVADEAGLVWGLVEELQRRAPGRPLEDALRSLDLEGAKALRRLYWAMAKARYGPEAEVRVFVDKFTMNTIEIGLINAIFPDATAIFMHRDPRDVCLSCVMQLMVPSDATVHLLTWRGAAALYARVMDLWLDIRPRLTLTVIEARYEDAVARFDDTYRRVFEALDLEFGPAARDYHRAAHGRHVASPSRNQVARPLYASSVGRWRRYAEQFRAVADLLDPFVEELGYGAEPPPRKEASPA